jgi:HlyD family secretion protein
MAYQSAKAQLLAAQDKLSLVKIGARDEEKAAAHAQVRQAEAGCEAAKQTLQLALDGKNLVAIRAKDVEAANDKIAASRGAVHEVAEYQRQTKIISPISGRISQRMSRSGEIIAPGYAIMSVVPTDHYWVDVYVDERQFAGRGIGDQVLVEIPALGRTVPGSISKILPAADFATKRANNERGAYDIRSVQLRITLNQSVDNLACGLTARVHFASEKGR